MEGIKKKPNDRKTKGNGLDCSSGGSLEGERGRGENEIYAF